VRLPPRIPVGAASGVVTMAFRCASPSLSRAIGEGQGASNSQPTNATPATMPAPNAWVNERYFARAI
jgi:hypothetical protein